MKEDDTSSPAQTFAWAQTANSPHGWFAAIGSLIFVAVALKLTADGVGVEGLRTLVTQAGLLAPLLYMVVRASTYVIAPLSIPGIETTAGLLFGIWWGTVLAVVGQTVGGCTSFWISRLFGRPIVARLVGSGGIERLESMYSRVHGWRGLLFARLLLPGYDFLSYAVGLTPLHFYQYVLVTALGGVPSTFLHVTLGSSLANDPVMFILASIGLGVLGAFAIYLAQSFERKRARRAGSERPVSVSDTQN